MRSVDEQQDPIEPPGYRELQLLSEVEENPQVTQRQLSQRAGIALGLTNVMLRNLVQKGYVRATQAGWKRWLYNLTPEGFSHKLRLTLGYVHRVLDHYKTVRHTLREQLAPLSLNAESRVAIYGTGEFAELVYLGLRDLGIEEIEIFDQNHANGARFLAMPVGDLASLEPERYDGVVLAILGDAEKNLTKLTEHGVDRAKLVAFFLDGKGRMGA